MNENGTSTARFPGEGTHVRAMYYLRGSVTEGTHSWGEVTFTGTLKVSPSAGKSAWAAITPDRELTGGEKKKLAATGCYSHQKRLPDSEPWFVIPADEIDHWTIEALDPIASRTPSITMFMEDETAETLQTIRDLALAGRSDEALFRASPEIPASACCASPARDNRQKSGGSGS